VIFWVALSALLILLTLFGTRRSLKLLDTFDEARLQMIRDSAEQTWLDVLAGAWALIALVGAAAGVVRGETSSVAWVCVAAALGLLIHVRRRCARATLEALGDRGEVERTGNDMARRKRMKQYGYTALALWAGSRIIESVGGEHPPTWAQAMIVAFAFLAFFMIIAMLFSTVGTPKPWPWERNERSKV
jgi:hypothetical protein